MRTTLDLPQDLMEKALKITGSRTKTELIKMALSHIIQKHRISALKSYRGRVELDIDLDSVRKRK